MEPDRPQSSAPDGSAAGIAPAGLSSPPDTAAPEIRVPAAQPARGLNMSAALARRLCRTSAQVLLIAGDIAAFAISYYLLLPFHPGGWDGAELSRVSALAAAAVLAFYASEKLYPGYRLQSHEHLRRRVTATFKVAALGAFGAILLPGGWRLALFIVGFLGIALIVQPVTHWLAKRLCRLAGLWGERAAIVAGPNRVPVLIEYFTRHWQFGIRPEPFSRDDAVQGKRPGIALIAGDTAPLLDELAAMRREFAEVILLADTPNLKVAGVRPADTGGQIGLCLALDNKPKAPKLVRRALDLAIAIPAALLFTPFILIAGAAIYAIDPGPVFFWQPREGLAGKPVRVLKLRTMYQDAERRLEKLLRDNPAIQAEWSAHFKLRQDPRILPVVGTLLRSASFDELPQLFNVIIGDMGIVGPRPFPEYHLLAMNAEFRHKRRTVTPGLTGLWQISERSNADLELQRQLDEFYIDNRSLWLDWHILLSTIPAVFRRNGAY
jgi:lipopolysaccharide/colanic/teichoic acid biosynthesis glycosyltransferase